MLLDVVLHYLEGSARPRLKNVMADSDGMCGAFYGNGPCARDLPRLQCPSNAILPFNLCLLQNCLLFTVRASSIVAVRSSSL
jgi:hypothetical protein